MLKRDVALALIPMLRILDDHYTNGKTLLPDRVYDNVREQARKAIPNHAYFKKIAAPLKAKGRKEVKLPTRMGSLDKKRPRDAINWLHGLPKGTEAVALPKLDGLALLLEYRNNKLYRAYTRGEDGITGFDVTENAQHIHGVLSRYGRKTSINPWQATRKTPPRISRTFVMGEAIIHKNTFAKKYQGKTLEKGGTPYRNARNFCIGMINRLNVKKQHIAALHDMTFITYDMQFVDQQDRLLPLHYAGVLNALAAYGFITVLAPRRKDVPRTDGLYGFWYADPQKLTLDRLNFMLKDWRSKFDLLQDGIVLSTCAPDRLINPGYKSGRPQFSFAVKPEVEDQQSYTGIVSHIAMDISKARIYYPVWILKQPLNFDGVEVRRISAGSMALLEKSKAGPGARINVVRSGDVIPHYISTVKSAPVELPRQCEYCNTKLKWTVNNKKERTHLFCPNEKCSGPQLRIMRHFFRVLKVDGMAEGVIEAMVAAKLDTIQKILSASPQQLARVEGFGERKTEKIIQGLRKIVQGVTLPKLMHASSLFSDEMLGVGLRRLEPIVSKLGRQGILVKKINPSQMKAELLEIPGIGAAVADRFIEGLIMFREFYRTVMGIVTISRDKRGRLLGKTYVFTGFRNYTMEELIEKNGGTVSTGISSKTNVLFAADLGTGKAIKAAEIGVRIVPKEQAEKYLQTQIG